MTGDIEHLDEWARDNPDDPILDLEDLMAQAQDLAAEQGHILVNVLATPDEDGSNGVQMRVYTDHGDDTTAGILTLAYDMYVEGRIDRKEN